MFKLLVLLVNFSICYCASCQLDSNFESKALQIVCENFDSIHFTRKFKVITNYLSSVKVSLDTNSFFFSLLKRCDNIGYFENMNTEDSLLNSRTKDIYIVKPSKKMLSKLTYSKDVDRINVTLFKRFYYLNKVYLLIKIRDKEENNFSFIIFNKKGKFLRQCDYFFIE